MSYQKIVEWDEFSLKLYGKRKILIGGEFHYWRIPDRERWESILKMYKSAGLNCIRIYFHWGFHETDDNIFNFQDNRDVNYLLEICKKLKLYVFVAAGPYICAETTVGGYPYYLIQRRDIRIRHMKKTLIQEYDEEYMKYCIRWYENFIPKIKDFQITEHKDGCIIGFQIENEYPEKMFIIKGQREYMESLKSNALRLGISVPIFHNDVWEANSWANLVDLYGFDKYIIWADKHPKDLPLADWNNKEFVKKIDKSEKKINSFGSPASEEPIFIPELQGGWYNHWTVPYGYDALYDYYGSTFQKIILQSYLAQKVGMAIFYMTYGGTNYGAIPNPEVYTSYDYSAGIREYGFFSDRIRNLRMINLFVKSFNDSMVKTDSIEDLDIKTSIKDIFYKERQSHDGTQFYFFRNFNSKKETEFTIRLLDKVTEDGKLKEGTIIPKIGTQKLKYRDGFIAIANHEIDGFKIKFCSMPIIVKANYLDGILLITVQNKGELILEGTGFKKKSYINMIEEKEFTRFSFVKTGNDVIISPEGKKLYIISLTEEIAKRLNAEFYEDRTIVVTGPYSTYITDEELEIETTREQEVRIMQCSGNTCEANLEGFSDMKNIEIPGVKFGTFGKKVNPLEIQTTDWEYIQTDWGSNNDSVIWKEIDIETERDPLDHGYISGHTFYKCTFNPGSEEELKWNTEKPKKLKIKINTRHKSAIWLNGNFLGYQENYNVSTINLFKPGPMNGPDPSFLGSDTFEMNKHIKPNEINTLLILTESLGQNKQFFPVNDCRNPRGILKIKLPKTSKNITWFISGINALNLKDPYNTSGLIGEQFNFHLGDQLENYQWQKIEKLELDSKDQILWLKKSFILEKKDNIRMPIRVHLNGKFNANIFVNGLYIGRYWGNRGPQNDFYIMDGILKKDNIITLACWSIQSEKETMSIEIIPYYIDKKSGNILDHSQGVPFITQKFRIKLK